MGVANAHVRFARSLFAPAPAPLPDKLRAARANEPTDVRLPVLGELPEVSVPLTDVPFDVVHRLVPRLFTLSCDPLLVESEDVLSHEDGTRAVACELRGSKFERAVLAHVMYGFSFQTVAHLMRSLQRAAEAGGLVRKQREEPLDVDEVEEGAKASDGLEKWSRDAALLQRNVMSFNLLAISKLLNQSWTFSLHLHASPYFGFGGLEARVVLFSPQMNFLSFHLLGICDPHTDVPNLVLLLQTLCADVHRKLMGVQIHLSAEQHRGMAGASASRVLAALYKLAPRKPLFFTPDVQRLLPQPPLLPQQLAALSTDQMKQLVHQYLPRLQLSWSAQQIQQILDDHAQLSQCTELADHEAHHADDTSFEQCWAFAQQRFRELRLFVGGLATASAYESSQLERVSITALELSTTNADQINVVADIVLHTRQFVQLRPFIVPES